MTIQGERIHTIEQMLDALEKSDASEKYDIALFCYGKLISAHDLLGDGICRLFDYVSSAELWKDHHDTQEEFQLRWEKAAKLQQREAKDTRTIEGIRRSNGPATRTRRICLPWLIGIQDDHETLEGAEADTWTELADITD
jgi:hypothetical protein